MPGLAGLADHGEIELGGDERVARVVGLVQELAARIDEIALAVKLADAPWLFDADAIDGSDPTAVCDR